MHATKPGEPMLLRPAGKDYLWGGTRLKTEYNKEIDMEPLAETWECSVHPDGPSRIVTGRYKGWTLDKVLQEHPEFMGTKVDHNSGFPVLMKFIDAAGDLSVQVHPDDEYAREHEHQNGKTEMWYVMDARPGAKLVCGFAHDVTEEQLRCGVEEGDLSKHLQKVDVYKGDVFFIPAGTVHAIGAGILIAEIQENSNLTYRVYDYDRVDRNGKKRELHFDKAMEVLNRKAGADVRQKPRIMHYYPGCSRELLCRCKYFETERIQMVREFSFSVLQTSFQVLLCLEGSGSVEVEGEGPEKILFSKGDCIFLPAGLGRCHVAGKAAMLKVRC